MFINEYGNRNDPTVVLLAPMMISGSDLYSQMSQFFQVSYHIIAPDQGGHGKAGAHDPPRISALRLYGSASEGIRGRD